MEVFLVLNGMELRAPVDDQERFMLALAAGVAVAPLASAGELARLVGMHSFRCLRLPK